MKAWERWLELDEAVDALRAGRLVGIPTETVYGLAADALNPSAVEGIFTAKGRPRAHPLIVHLPGLHTLGGWVAPPLPKAAIRLGEALWPGPLTLILPRGPLALDAVTGGLPTVGVRVPAHPVALALLEAFGSGLAAPSANRFGHVSPTTGAHVLADFPEDALAGVLDGGQAGIGIESTIVDLSGPRPAILRHGGISPEELAEVLGEPPEDHTATAPTVVRAPGQVSSHYAPKARLEVCPPERLRARRVEREGAGDRVVVLGRAELGGDADAWARSLYAALRAADATGPDLILVEAPPAGRLAMGVADRLRRAATR